MTDLVIAEYEDIANVADAIRSKTGITDTMTLSEMASNVMSISGTDITIDSDLSETSTNPVQNKVVTKEIRRLSEEIVDLENDVSTDVTIKDYKHTNLSVGEKITIYPDDRYEHAPRVFLGKNFFPNTPYVCDNVYATLGTSLVTDGYNFTVKGTPTKNSEYKLIQYEGASEYWELPDGLLSGDSIDIYVFTDKNTSGRCPTLNVRIYDANKTQLVRIYVSTVNGVSYSTKLNQVIPEGAKYVRYEFAYGTGDGTEYNRTIHPVIVKSGTEIINDLTFENGLCEITLDSDYDVVCTAPYESSIIRERTFNQYVSEMNNSYGKEESSIVTPEMFGAYADGKHDDTQAIQKAIDYGFANKKKVICGGNYLIAFPIYITGSFNFVEINYIYYKGTDCAVVISGNHNNVKINYVNSQGVSIRVQSDVECSYNNIYVGYVSSQKNGVEYIATAHNIISNRLTFNRITVWDEGDCIYQTPTISLPKGYLIGNNEFIGGHLSGNGWAVYGAKGSDTYITPRFENVKNGIYCDNVGYVRVFSPRCPEFVQQAFKYTDNGYVHYPDKGVLFAINVATSSTELGISTKGSGLLAYGFTGIITPWNFDLKGAMLEVLDKGTIRPIHKSYPGATEVQMKLWGKDTVPFAHSFLIFGNHILIKDPIRKRKKTIMANDHGYSGDYSVTYKNDEFYIYDEFTVGESGCDYTLPPSYDQIAFDHFYVNQPDGTYCTLRDWRGTVVFDGETLGSGRYEVDIRCSDDVYDNYLNEGQVWYIRRVDNGELVATMPLTV